MGGLQPALQKDNAFWRFSLTIYRVPDVAAECLALQEALSADVNLLLFCAWIGNSRGATMTEADIEGARSVVNAWHEQTVRPLRHARQFMKPFADPECQVLRTRVKGNELEAEQIEQAMLFAHAQTAWAQSVAADPSLAVPANVQAYLAAQQRIAPGNAPLPQHLIGAAIAYRSRP